MVQVLVPEKTATREQLQLMMYRRFPSQAFANVQLIQSLIDDARAQKNGPESKIQVCQTSQNSMPTLHRHCLNHLRLRLDAEKDLYLAMPSPLYHQLRGNTLDKALTTSSVSSSLPKALDRPALQLPGSLNMSSKRRLTETATCSTAVAAFEDDDSLGLLANNDAVVLEADFMDDTELRDMAVFRVVHAQPHRLKRQCCAQMCARYLSQWLSCHVRQCNPTATTIVTRQPVRPLRAEDDLKQRDLALCPYRILERTANAAEGVCRIRVARARTDSIAAADFFDDSLDVNLLCKHLVAFRPDGVQHQCCLRDATFCNVILDMVKAGAFADSQSSFHELDDVDIWDALREFLSCRSG